MSGTLTFFIALLGAGVGGFLALLLYSLCVVAGDADDYREAYRAGWDAARDKGRGEEETRADRRGVR